LFLTVPELPVFHLRFQDQRQLETWQRELDSILSASRKSPHSTDLPERSISTREAETRDTTRYTPRANSSRRISSAPHVPVDLVIALPVSASTHEVKLAEFQDILRFVVHNLGPSDRLGVITYGGENDVRRAALAPKSWPGWDKAINSIKVSRSKAARTSLIEGSGLAMDMLMERKVINPITSVFLVSDSSVSETESPEFLISRAEAAK